MSEQMWNERHSAPQRVWSGEPNPWLVDVASTLPGGTALDLGRGEGADAIWLARHCWDVTAVDFSSPDDPAVASTQRRTRGDACDVVVELVRR